MCPIGYNDIYFFQSKYYYILYDMLVSQWNLGEENVLYDLTCLKVINIINMLSLLSFLVLAGLYLRSSVEMVMRRAIDRVRYITQL
jgi:hypothetical protein